MFQDAASIADIIGAIGVMISLVFVGVQVMQANKLARSAAIREQNAAMARVSQVFGENRELADIWVRARAGREVTETEQAQLIASLTYIERIQEGLYWQYLEGQIDRELWEAHRRQTRAAQNNPLVQAIWSARKDWYSTRYRDYRDGETAKAGETTIRYDILPAASPPAEPPKS
ncbi:MAG TPA: hypothetical protein VGO52_22265 [Hyphomonadaceae bacterium]|jgi:hypothetical protein|nr:hypothetical protein [Hyphomonadaceae bacterium]